MRMDRNSSHAHTKKKFFSVEFCSKQLKLAVLVEISILPFKDNHLNLIYLFTFRGFEPDILKDL
jgi:hypothetical protein